MTNAELERRSRRLGRKLLPLSSFCSWGDTRTIMEAMREVIELSGGRIDSDSEYTQVSDEDKK